MKVERDIIKQKIIITGTPSTPFTFHAEIPRLIVFADREMIMGIFRTLGIGIKRIIYDVTKTSWSLNRNLCRKIVFGFELIFITHALVPCLIILYAVLSQFLTLSLPLPAMQHS